MPRRVLKGQLLIRGLTTACMALSKSSLPHSLCVFPTSTGELDSLLPLDPFMMAAPFSIIRNSLGLWPRKFSVYF